MLGDLSKEVLAKSTRRALCRSECVRPCSWMKRSDAPCRSACGSRRNCAASRGRVHGPRTGRRLRWTRASVATRRRQAAAVAMLARAKKTAFGSRAEMRALSKLIKAFSSRYSSGSCATQSPRVTMLSQRRSSFLRPVVYAAVGACALYLYLRYLRDEEEEFLTDGSPHAPQPPPVAVEPVERNQQRRNSFSLTNERNETLGAVDDAPEAWSWQVSDAPLPAGGAGAGGGHPPRLERRRRKGVRFQLDSESGFYGFVFSYEGTCAAHGGDASNVGKTLGEIMAAQRGEACADAAEALRRRFVQAAEAGGGFVEYAWGARGTLKGAYVIRVTDGRSRARPLPPASASTSRLRCRSREKRRAPPATRRRRAAAGGRREQRALLARLRRARRVCRPPRPGLRRPDARGDHGARRQRIDRREGAALALCRRRRLGRRLGRVHVAQRARPPVPHARRVRHRARRPAPAAAAVGRQRPAGRRRRARAAAAARRAAAHLCGLRPLRRRRRREALSVPPSRAAAAAATAGLQRALGTLAESSSAGSLERIVRDSDGIMAAAAASARRGRRRRCPSLRRGSSPTTCTRRCGSTRECRSRSSSSAPSEM